MLISEVSFASFYECCAHKDSQLFVTGQSPIRRYIHLNTSETQYLYRNGNRGTAAKSPPAPGPSPSGGRSAGELAVRDQTEGPGQHEHLLRDGAKCKSKYDLRSYVMGHERRGGCPWSVMGGGLRDKK